MPVRIKPPTSDTSFMPGRTSPGPSPGAEEWAEILATGSGESSMNVGPLLPKGNAEPDVHILNASENIEMDLEVKYRSGEWHIEDPGSGTGDRAKFEYVVTNPPMYPKNSSKEDTSLTSPDRSVSQLLNTVERWLTGDLAEEIIGEAFEQLARISSPAQQRKIALMAVATVVLLTIKAHLSAFLSRRSA